MKDLPAPITPDRWLAQMFGARIAVEGGIVRRKVEDIERLVGRRRFLHEVDRRGFHVVENAGQFVVFCNQEPVIVLR
jgi:hypothetical protein